MADMDDPQVFARAMARALERARPAAGHPAPPSSPPIAPEPDDDYSEAFRAIKILFDRVHERLGILEARISAAIPPNKELEIERDPSGKIVGIRGVAKTRLP
jgi:hypothetical protein